MFVHTCTSLYIFRQPLIAQSTRKNVTAPNTEKTSFKTPYKVTSATSPGALDDNSLTKLPPTTVLPVFHSKHAKQNQEKEVMRGPGRDQEAHRKDSSLARHESQDKENLCSNKNSGNKVKSVSEKTNERTSKIQDGKLYKAEVTYHKEEGTPSGNTVSGGEFKMMLEKSRKEQTELIQRKKTVKIQPVEGQLYKLKSQGRRFRLRDVIDIGSAVHARQQVCAVSNFQLFRI